MTSLGALVTERLTMQAVKKAGASETLKAATWKAANSITGRNVTEEQNPDGPHK